MLSLSKNSKCACVLVCLCACVLVCLCACPCSYRVWERALEIFDVSLVVDDRLLEFFADGFKGINFGTDL